MTKKPYTPLKKKRIKVAGLTYKIKYFTKDLPNSPRPDPKDKDYDPDSWVVGSADLDNRIISIYKYLSPQEHDFTLCHEILHCSLEACKSNEIFHEEDFVKPLSRILYATLVEVGLIQER